MGHRPCARAVPEPSIELRWSGVLRDDIGAGEAPGRIHNTRMRAHVGEEGVYVSTRRRLASGSRHRTITELERTRRAALQLDARRHLAGAAGGERQPSSQSGRS